jgi:hypothetical protein
MNNREKVMLKVAGYKHDYAGASINPIILGLAGAGIGGLTGAGLGAVGDIVDGGGPRHVMEGAGIGAGVGAGLGAGVGGIGQLIGLLHGSIANRAKKEDIKGYNKDPLTSYLVPGAGVSRLIQRRRGMAGILDPSNTTYKAPAEILGPMVGGIVPGANLVGILAGLISKKRTMAEQKGYETKTHGAVNMLPGVGGYNLVKALQLSNDIK